MEPSDKKVLGGVKISDGKNIPTSLIPGVEILQLEDMKLNVNQDDNFWQIYDLPDSRIFNEFSSQLYRNYFWYRILES